MRPTFLLLFFLPLLMSCGGPATTTISYEPIETPGGRLCSGQCNEAENYCKESCGLDYRQCTGKVQTQAMQDFDKYTREQFAAQQAIELRPRDFERMMPCNDKNTSCTEACDGTYQACYKNCGGKIDVTTSCQFMCF